MSQHYLILRKNGDDRYLIGECGEKSSAEAYNATYFEYVHWVTENSGPVPPLNNLEPWVDTRTKKQKREDAYLMEAMPLRDKAEGDIDDGVDPTIAKAPWRACRADIKLRYP